MATEGWQFAAELSRLRIVGRVDLPAMGYTYASMNQVVAGTQNDQQLAFAAPGGGTSAAFAGWASVRDDLMNLFGRTANALHAAGATIEEIVTTYADSDTAARDSLNSAWANGQRPGLDDYEEKYRTDAPAIVLKPQS